MNFKSFIKEKTISLAILLFVILTIEVFLIIYPIEMFIRIYIPVAIIAAYFIGIMIEYYTKKKFYTTFINTLNELEEKYLINEIINNPSFLEGKILKESLNEIDKSMIENVNKYKNFQEEYKEYIELWIHEIKLPIAVSKMVIENNKNEATKSIDEELDKVENYIEQALFYARSNTVEKDYYIRKSKLKEIVNESIKKNKSSFIQEKINLNLHDLENEVYTDNKWVIFILNQIIQNSVKYMKKSSKKEIEIYSIKRNESVILYIKDNGIGIKPGEISKVFEKGFTGTNGRKSNKKSTGIGLYLCKKLCDKLGINIVLNSKENEGTEVKLVFPRGSFIALD